MEEIIKIIIEQNSKLLGINPKVKKINVGFTNTLYNINDSYVVKICTDFNNEEEFQKEINFYNTNSQNPLIPKLYYSNTDKFNIPYFYEIIEKLNGISLYNIWHTYSEKQRENVIKQLCNVMKQIHSIKGEKYNWSELIKNKFTLLYKESNELNIFNTKEQKILEEAYLLFDKYLETDEFVLVHNDLHFDNIFIDNEKIKIIDFERSMFAPRDFELDIIYRMIRKPWKFASEETEKHTDISQYSNIMSYIEKYYPKLMNIPCLYKRLAIYDIVYFLEQLVKNSKLDELKKDVLSAARIVISKLKDN